MSVRIETNFHEVTKMAENFIVKELGEGIEKSIDCNTDLIVDTLKENNENIAAKLEEIDHTLLMLFNSVDRAATALERIAKTLEHSQGL